MCIVIDEIFVEADLAEQAGTLGFLDLLAELVQVGHEEVF